MNIRTRKGIFTIVLEQWNGEPGYVVRVPKLPEIVTQGDTIVEARRMAAEAIELCVQCNNEGIRKSLRDNRITLKV